MNRKTATCTTGRAPARRPPALAKKVHRHAALALSPASAMSLFSFSPINDQPGDAGGDRSRAASLFVDDDRHDRSKRSSRRRRHDEREGKRAQAPTKSCSRSSSCRAAAASLPRTTHHALSFGRVSSSSFLSRRKLAPTPKKSDSSSFFLECVSVRAFLRVARGDVRMIVCVRECV